MQYKGVGYPIEKNPYGYFSTGNNIQQIKASMLAIIMTRPGERVMRPNFGTPLYRLLRRPAEVVSFEARQMIALSLKRWEKRVQVTDIQTTLMGGGILHIEVQFIDPTNLQEIHQLTVQVSLE
jgi:phage baseplate assembly protein W